MERDTMKMPTINTEFTGLPKDYAGLCRILIPRPIHDKVEFQSVTEITDAMAGHKLTADQEDYFDLLCRLIEDYEKEHVEAPKLTIIEALQHLLDAHGMNTADLARLVEVYWVALAPEFGRGRASQQAVLQGSRLAGLFPVECYLAASAPVRAVG